MAAAPCAVGCAVPGGDADFNGNWLVNLTDLSLLLANFANTAATHADGDSNRDGDVDITDLGAVLGRFGVDCTS